MNAKKIILFVVIILVVGGAFGWYFLNNLERDSNGQVISNGEAGSPTFPIIEDQEENLPPPGPIPYDPNSPTNLPLPVYATHNINIQEFKFDKSSLSIKQGDTVVWTNKDSVTHTVTGAKGPNSEGLSKDATYRFTFSVPGTYPYKCILHPNMTGTITVTK